MKKRPIHLSLNNGLKDALHAALLLLAWLAVSGSASAALMQWLITMLNPLSQLTIPIAWTLCSNG
jgi:hypothetical protein